MKEWREHYLILVCVYLVTDKHLSYMHVAHGNIVRSSYVSTGASEKGKLYNLHSSAARVRSFCLSSHGVHKITMFTWQRIYRTYMTLNCKQYYCNLVMSFLI
jgi:hypothetical protein